MTLSSFTLTREDELQLAAVAEAVVKNTVSEYNEHLTVHNGVVDERRWKKIKHRDDMRVYREKSSSFEGATGGMSFGGSQSTHSHSSSETDGENTEDSKTLARLLTFGSIEGSLEDVLYGAINPSLEDMQLKTAYVDDGFVDWTLLASIITPSEQDPFRELSLKHTVKANPLLVGAVVRQRSALYLESCGIAQTPNGERIGYHLYHSVDVPGFCEQPGVSVVRFKISSCYLFRQRRASSVEVFMRATFDPMGDAPASLVALSSAEVSIAVSRNTHCAEMKKLTRILSSQPSSVRAMMSSSSSASGGSSGSGGTTRSDGATIASSSDGQVSCEQCNKRISSKFKLLRSSSKEKNCAMCDARLCSGCRVYKTIFLPSVAKEKELTQSSQALCTGCLSCVASAWSATFAALDARAARGEDVDYVSALGMSKGDASRLRKVPQS